MLLRLRCRLPTLAYKSFLSGVQPLALSSVLLSHSLTLLLKYFFELAFPCTVHLTTGCQGYFFSITEDSMHALPPPGSPPWSLLTPGEVMRMDPGPTGRSTTRGHACSRPCPPNDKRQRETAAGQAWERLTPVPGPPDSLARSVGLSLQVSLNYASPTKPSDPLSFTQGQTFTTS